LSKTTAITRALPGSTDTTALAVRPTTEPWLDPEWQRLWLSVAVRPWRSLGLVPAGNGGSPDFTLIVAMTLSRTGMVHLGSPIQVADATQIPLSDLNSFLHEVHRCTSSGHRVLVALPSTDSGPSAATIAQALDAAVLCVLMGKMKTPDAQKTLKAVGPSRFLGSVVLHANRLPLSEPPKSL